MHHSDLIYHLFGLCGFHSYLELGVYDGLTLNKIYSLSSKTTGVDIVDIRPNKISSFYLGKTDDFFIQNKETYDMIFIDGDHSFEQVKKDFENSMSILNKHGIIILHDTDPVSIEYLDPGYCGDSYKMLPYLNTQSKYQLDVITLPINEAGLTIIKRHNERRVINYV